MLLLQPLSKAHARGEVVTYCVNTTCFAYSDEREIPAGDKIQVDLPLNTSCTVQLHAGTEHGYNKSLCPSSVRIPSHHDGQSLSLCTGTASFVSSFYLMATDCHFLLLSTQSLLLNLQQCDYAVDQTHRKSDLHAV